MFSGKNVVLGVTGSIAAYKAADLAGKLTQAGIQVNVIMTKAATEFVSPLTFRSITHRPVVTDIFDISSEYSVEHVALAQKADAVVVAPATANVIAKLAAGIADDMLGCTVLATRAPVIVAPAMNVGMYQNQVTQENLSKLLSRGFTMVGPAYGRLASGAVGMGRLIENDVILAAIYQVLGRTGDLAGRKVVVTAGGTHEAIDLVRFIGNRSSGKMGFAVAEAARNRGASVTLISGPATAAPPFGVDIMKVESALEMREAVLKTAATADVLIMTAAVADYRPSTPLSGKIKREADTLSIDLVKTPDILSEVKANMIKVGFAAESEEVISRARKKLSQKRLDLIVVNDITARDSGFNVDTNKVTMIDSQGNEEALPLMLKSEVAGKILDKVVALLSKK